MSDEPRTTAPLPWQKYHSIIQPGMCDVFDADESLLAVVSPHVATLFLRAPAVEQAAKDAEQALSQLWLCADRTRSKLISARLNPGYHEGLDEAITQARDALKVLRAALENASG